MKGKKKILLAVVLVLVMAVGITSIVVIRKRNKIVVKVFPVSSLNSSDWFDTDTSLTGTLTSDFIQEVHVSGGQKVKCEQREQTEGVITTSPWSPPRGRRCADDSGPRP